MADLTLRGMVIRTVDYRDNDRILTLFTAEQGRVDAKARNCRKATSPLLACTQPFTYGEYQLFYHKNKYIVDQGEVLESFYPLREDVGRFAAASLCAALCLEGVQAEESSEAIFSLLYHTLSFLTYGENDPGDLTACFLVASCPIGAGRCAWPAPPWGGGSGKRPWRPCGGCSCWTTTSWAGSG